jgi:hypothetical protein
MGTKALVQLGLWHLCLIISWAFFNTVIGCICLGKSTLLIVSSLCFSFSYKQNTMQLLRIHHVSQWSLWIKPSSWWSFLCSTKIPSIFTQLYHSVNVIGFILAYVATIIFITMRCCLFCYQKFTITGTKMKRHQLYLSLSWGVLFIQVRSLWFQYPFYCGRETSQLTLSSQILLPRDSLLV